MKIGALMMVCVVAVVGSVLVTGCGRKSDSEPAGKPGVGERTGAAIDRAAKKTGETVKNAAEATKDATGKAVEKTGEALEKAGENMQK